eukprot:GHVP01051844.1.p1 GENE.GHVP01051844.1~~GHVP01051844.1.p1  ORF type:complete len:103 (-),score=9.16 GHVP01051844.1:57-365(-)
MKHYMTFRDYLNISVDAFHEITGYNRKDILHYFIRRRKNKKIIKDYLSTNHSNPIAEDSSYKQPHQKDENTFTTIDLSTSSITILSSTKDKSHSMEDLFDIL